jgi:hypothetical protein
MVIKSTTAHIFTSATPDLSRFRQRAGTADQRYRVIISSQQSYLGRALGVNPQIEIDYQSHQVEKGDVFVLATDGVYEHVPARFIARAIRTAPTTSTRRPRPSSNRPGARQSGQSHRPDRPDRCSPAGEASECSANPELPLPPLLKRGWRSTATASSELHASSRSHIYLAVDADNDELVALKIPSIDLRGDPAYLKRFMMEEWVARRINSAHVLKPCLQSRKRNYLYVVTEFIDGQTLAQWMIDHPKPDLETIRGIVEQIAKGLRAFHRKEMLHQDLRPDNVMIDRTGTVKIIDRLNPGHRRSSVAAGRPRRYSRYLPVHRAGIFHRRERLVALRHLRSDHHLPDADGRLPYGAKMARTRTNRSSATEIPFGARRQQQIPAWIDGVLKKAVHPDPYKRYEALSEFSMTCVIPMRVRQCRDGAPDRAQSAVVLEGPSAVLLLVVVALLAMLHGGGSCEGLAGVTAVALFSEEGNAASSRAAQRG